MKNTKLLPLCLSVLMPPAMIDAGETSLTRPDEKYQRSTLHQFTLRRGPITAVVSDNARLPGKPAGYSGIVSLVHEAHPANLFVPSLSGLGLNQIFDGSPTPDEIAFEPRRAPMELRVIDAYTVELYQPPTSHWKLES